MDLVEAMRKEFSLAKVWRTIIGLLQFIGAVAAAYSTLEASDKAAIAIGGLSIISSLAVFFLKGEAGFHKALGERLHRLLVLHDGLGIAPTQKDALEIRADSTAFPSLDPRPTGNYFTSPMPRGLGRTAHIVEEAAFFTRKVALASAWSHGAIAIVGMLFAIALLWIAVQAPISPNAAMPLDLGARTAKVFSILFLFFAAGTFADQWKSYRSLAGAAKSVFDKCDSLRRQEQINELDVYSALSAYEVAVAMAPPLPGLVYRLYRKRLNEAWALHMTSHSRGEGASPEL